MRLDVIELKEFYYGTELGRTTRILVNGVLDKKINTDLDSLTIGFGFACPFLENKINDSDNKNFILLMPSEQGVIPWPKKSKNITFSTRKHISYVSATSLVWSKNMECVKIRYYRMFATIRSRSFIYLYSILTVIFIKYYRSFYDCSRNF